MLEHFTLGLLMFGHLTFGHLTLGLCLWRTTKPFIRSCRGLHHQGRRGRRDPVGQGLVQAGAERERNPGHPDRLPLVCHQVG